MAAVGLCCSFTAQYFAAKASVGCATELRQAVFDHIQALSFTELDTIGTDTLITRLINDINQVQNGINMGLRLLLRSPFTVFGSVVMAFTVNVKMCHRIPGYCSDPVRCRIRHYAGQHPAVQKGTGGTRPRHRNDKRKFERCSCHPCVLP